MSKKIYINPGHSDVDPGAVGYETERKLNVRVSEFMRAYLAENFDCELKVTPGAMDSLAAVCKEANDWGADLFVSNHFNAGGGDGFECYVYAEKNRPMGQIFEKQVKAVGQNSRGVKIKQFYVLKYTYMPAILTESAFVDNRKDIQDWNEDAELKKLGEAYAKAAAEFLGLPEKAQPVPAAYTQEQFIREVQAAIGAAVDGIAGSETLSKTVTLSSSKNRTHPAVKPVQKYLATLGYTVVGAADGMAGQKFEAAVVQFQEDNKCWADGEITARNKTWKKLLGLV